MKRNYTCPEICIFSFVTEKGFAQSVGGGITDYTKNPNDEMDD